MFFVSLLNLDDKTFCDNDSSRNCTKIKHICKVGQSYLPDLDQQSFIAFHILYISSRIWFWLCLGGSWFTYLQFSLFIFWTGEDMVSYERPIWEFVFDRVAAPDKKSILLVMYSDLFTARSRTSSAACRKSLQIPTRVGPTSFSLEWFFVDFLVGNFFRVYFFGIFWYTIQPQILRFFACHFQDWETRW